MSKLVNDFKEYENKTIKELSELHKKEGVSFVVRAGKIVQIIEDPQKRNKYDMLQEDFNNRKGMLKNPVAEQSGPSIEQNKRSL